MTIRSNLAKGLIGVAAVMATLTAASAVQAQAYGGAYDQRGYAYDPCARDTTTRGTTGGLAGAALGAAIGGSVAAGGAKTEGAVLGGLLGAVAGNRIGNASAACAPGYSSAPAPTYYAPEPPPPPPPPPSAYYQAPAYGTSGGAYAQGSYYDPCARDRTTRGTTGGLAGAAIGALAGGNVAARNARTEGAVLGALAGAALGSKVGRDGAACTPGAAVPPPAYRYQGGYEQPYAQGGYQSYDSRYPRGRDDGYTYAPVADARADVNGCSLAESPIYLPDGRTQKRFVRVCPDANGRYQVVD